MCTCVCIVLCCAVLRCVVYTLLQYVMTNIHQLKRNCRINGANFDVQNGFTTQLRVCDWFAFDGSWLMSKYNFVYVHNCCVHTKYSFSHRCWHTCSTLIPFNSTLFTPPLIVSFRFFVLLSVSTFSSIYYPQSACFRCGFSLPLALTLFLILWNKQVQKSTYLVNKLVTLSSLFIFYQQTQYDNAHMSIPFYQISFSLWLHGGFFHYMYETRVCTV